MRLRADTCEVRQAPGEQSLIIWRQGGPGRTEEEEEEKEKGKEEEEKEEEEEEKEQEGGCFPYCQLLS